MDGRRHPEGMSPADQPEVAEHIVQARNGNPEAWGELYNTYAVHGIPFAILVDARGVVIEEGSLEGILPSARNLADSRH